MRKEGISAKSEEKPLTLVTIERQSYSKQLNFEYLFSMTVRAPKRKARQRSAQDLGFLPSNSFLTLDTEKNNFTEEQLSDKNQ